MGNKPIKVKSKYVVGCDGGTSNIRKILGIKLKGLSFNERWLIVDLFNTTNKFRHTQVHCDSKRPCITLPGPNGIRRYEFKLKESECQDYESEESFVRNFSLKLAHIHANNYSLIPIQDLQHAENH